MSFSHAIYQLLIGPLQLIYEFVFYYSKMFTHSTGIAIIALGLAVNFLLLPLYRQADAIQDEERAKQKHMDRWVRHIKKTFKGNERFMMLQTYYRQNHYRPYYALRGMLPLVLEIPFFIAAYNYLSGLEDLNTTFSFIGNLSKPDALLSIGGVNINILPIIMTVVNIISGAIYTRGLKAKDKIQLYGMAVLFLVLLYDSPSGLVIYWTVNNLFSLVKNIICTMKHKRLAVNITLSVLGVLAVVWSFIMTKDSFEDCIPLIDAGLLLQVPALLSLIKKPLSVIKGRFREHKPSLRLYLSGCIFLTLLMGVLIPSAVVASSPVEFVFYGDFHHPLVHLLNSFLLAAGMFLVWFGLLYYLSGQRLRWILNVIVWVMSGLSVVNYMFFGNGLGNISSELEYDLPLEFSALEHIINLVVIAAVITVFCIIWKKSKRAVQTVYVVMSLALVGMSVTDVCIIMYSNGRIYDSIENVDRTNRILWENDGKLIHLSKNKQNVIVLMMDRAVGTYLPYILQEKPELAEKLDGFTYYPNTVSYGLNTNFGSPPLYGGYEYTPAKMNERSDVLLKEKQNEALRVMPINFDNNNYDVTVIEPTYANYCWVPDLSIYKDHPDIQAYNIEQGQMNTEWLDERSGVLNAAWSRNFFCYSLMKSSPCFMQAWLYERGNYYASTINLEKDYKTEKTIRLKKEFMNSHSVLVGLPSLTSYDDTESSTFLMMSNSTTHEPQLLREPDYVPDEYADNTDYDMTHKSRFTYNGKTLHTDEPNQMETYHVNMASLLRLADWFDEMRKNGVYDNTRIIIVADHGTSIGQRDDLMLDKERNDDVMGVNPLLLVKDFNSKGFTVDESFMTQADVPTMTFDGLISDPVNPATGNKINNDAKKEDQEILFSANWDTNKNNGTTFLPGQWYTVHDNIFDLSNWKKGEWK